MPTTQFFKAAHAVAEGRAFVFGGLEDEVKLNTLTKVILV